jgi:hypothetical protein
LIADNNNNNNKKKTIHNSFGQEHDASGIGGRPRRIIPTIIKRRRTATTMTATMRRVTLVVENGDGVEDDKCNSRSNDHDVVFHVDKGP